MNGNTQICKSTIRWSLSGDLDVIQVTRCAGESWGCGLGLFTCTGHGILAMYTYHSIKLLMLQYYGDNVSVWKQVSLR